MLKRKITATLEKWYSSEHLKVPILYGARQVGKTTAVREFAKAHYKHFVEINFVKTPLAKRGFDGELSTKAIITNLSAMGFGPFINRHTLIFFDEIQECPKARTALKFLAEEKYFDYIASGSLLGINYKPVPSFPVGFEERYNVYPMDFEEFLWAKGISENVLEILQNAAKNKTALPDFLHEQISRYYREYLVIGGMPEVVHTFVTQMDFGTVIKVQRSILDTYRSDISHYAGHMAGLVKRVFDALPAELGKQDKRFILSNIEKGASLRKYEDPTQWLIDAEVAYYSFNTNALELPFEATENRRLYKLYMVDTGLLCAQLLKTMQFKVMNGDIDINEGALAENFIACVLASKEISLHYYDRKSKQELDFIIPDEGKITLIEVKSGSDYKKHTSLNSAINSISAKLNQCIVFSKGNIEFEKGVLYLPLYLAEWVL